MNPAARLCPSCGQPPALKTILPSEPGGPYGECADRFHTYPWLPVATHGFAGLPHEAQPSSAGLDWFAFIAAERERFRGDDDPFSRDDEWVALMTFLGLTPVGCDGDHARLQHGPGCYAPERAATKQSLDVSVARTAYADASITWYEKTKDPALYGKAHDAGHLERWRAMTKAYDAYVAAKR